MRPARRLVCLMRLPLRRDDRERVAEASRRRRQHPERRGSRLQPTALDVFLFAGPDRRRRHDTR